MKKNIKLLSIVLLVGGMFSFGLVTEPNHAVKNNQDFKWEKLGSRKVNMVADHDEILVNAYKGFFTTGGSLEVGKASTSAVTNSCIAVLLADYALAQLLMG